MKEHYSHDGFSVYVKIGDADSRIVCTKLVCTVEPDMRHMAEIICEWMNYAVSIG